MYRNSNKLKDLESDEDESDTELLVPGGKPASQSTNSNAIKLFDLQEIFSSCLISSTALENRMRHNARYDEDYADIQYVATAPRLVDVVSSAGLTFLRLSCDVCFL